MTTDPFTDAANAAAREYARTPRMNVGTVQDRIGEAHADGWEAARTHLAAQEPTDAEVEAAARAIYVQRASYHTAASWEREPETVKTLYRKDARAVLSAASAARRDEEKRAACGCDLTGPVPPAVHIVDRHEERR